MKVAGIDCSAWATRVVVCDNDTGDVLRRGRAAHPKAEPGEPTYGTPIENEADPRAWLRSLGEAADGLLDDVDAIAVTAQQHGVVPLDSDGDIIRPALLYQDQRDSSAATELLDELGGARGWADDVGTVPQTGWTISKLRWFARNEPETADRIAQVLLPHDWLTWQLMDRPKRCVTDRGDASGTGYFSPRTGRWRPDLVELALGHETVLPHVLEPSESAGRSPEGVRIAAGTGSLMATALGLGAQPGDAVISLAGGGTAFVVHDEPLATPAGAVTPFADATGGYLPLVETMNASLVLPSTAALLSTDPHGLSDLAQRSTPGAHGLVMLPYLEGERVPDLPHAAGTIAGLRAESMRPEHLARAAVEGVVCAMVDALDVLRSQGAQVRRVLLLGAAARLPAIQDVAPLLCDVPVVVPPPASYPAMGAARQAAWSLRAANHAADVGPPDWDPLSRCQELEPDPALSAVGEAVRDQYQRARDDAHPTEAEKEEAE